MLVAPVEFGYGDVIRAYGSLGGSTMRVVVAAEPFLEKGDQVQLVVRR